MEGAPLIPDSDFEASSEKKDKRKGLRKPGEGFLRALEANDQEEAKPEARLFDFNKAKQEKEEKKGSWLLGDLDAEAAKEAGVDSTPAAENDSELKTETEPVIYDEVVEKVSSETEPVMDEAEAPTDGTISEAEKADAYAKIVDLNEAEDEAAGVEPIKAVDEFREDLAGDPDPDPEASLHRVAAQNGLEEYLDDEPEAAAAAAESGEDEDEDGDGSEGVATEGDPESNPAEEVAEAVEPSSEAETEAGLEAEEIPEQEAETELEPDSPEDDLLPDETETGPEIDHQTSPEDETEPDADQPDPTAATNTGTGPTGTGAGTANPAGPPPVAPTFGGGGPGWGGGPGGPGNVLPHGPGFPNPAAANFDPTLLAANQVPVQQPEMSRRVANPATMALFGGIIGYLIGRRRGRIKTERKLLPIQKKLEKEVTDLQWQIREKEDRLRRAAARKAQREGLLVTTAAATGSAAESALESDKNPTISGEVPIDNTPIERTKEVNSLNSLQAEQLTLERQRAPEANQLHGTKAHEHLGQVLLAAGAAAAIAGRESLKSEKPELSPSRLEVSINENNPEAKLVADKSAETLTRQELMEVSEKILVDGNSLRQIYETRLIGERGLRRLIAEYQRGGDMQAALRREVVEHEIDFERDPAMRDAALTEDAPKPKSGGAADSGASGGTVSSSLDQLIESAASKVEGTTDGLSYYNQHINKSSRSDRTSHHRRRMDMIMIVVIGSLFAAVFFAVIMRLAL